MFNTFRNVSSPTQKVLLGISAFTIVCESTFTCIFPYSRCIKVVGILAILVGIIFTVPPKSSSTKWGEMYHGPLNCFICI